MSRYSDEAVMARHDRAWAEEPLGVQLIRGIGAVVIMGGLVAGVVMWFMGII